MKRGHRLAFYPHTPHSPSYLELIYPDASRLSRLSLLCNTMASVASVPAYLLPGIPAAHPPHLEGDATLATEILPGPPLLNTVKQAAFKRPTVVSYIPTSDPGSTYTGWAPPAIVVAPVEGDEPRRKRVRADSGCVRNVLMQVCTDMCLSRILRSPPSF
jgi:hypothetical protein